MASHGRPHRWGEPTSAVSVRWPESHREFYAQRAQELGMPFSEYVIREMAERHGLDLSGGEDSDQLQLTA